MTAIGRPLPRREDARFLTGQGRYLDDMGFAGPLREPIVSDADGHHVTGSLMDYGIAAAGDLPPIEIVSHHSPSTRTPTGSKGMSEGGVMGAVGAVTLAVNDALAPFGVVADRQPLTPPAVLALLRGQG